MVIGLGGVFLLVGPAGVHAHLPHFVRMLDGPADLGGNVLGVPRGEVQARDPVLNDLRNGA